MNTIKRLLKQLIAQQSSYPVRTTKLSTKDEVQSLIDCLATTREDEMDCLEFNRRMDCLAEMLAEGKSAEEVLTPEIEAHLRHSADCREEFDALLAILKAEESGELDSA